MAVGFTIREGRKEDLPAALSLIQELADYEKAPDEVDNTVALMEEEGFGDQPRFAFFVAENAEQGIVGLALYFYSYSTWKGTCLYLEDLVVQESMRGKGLGKALFDAVAMHAKRINAKRLQWQVLDWNEPAIGFYRDVLGAELDSTWINCRLTYEQLQAYPG
ncbi:MAG TPA: GNAT family N-acetyltransferase [Cytophagales bacterium]|nr:GNAT family N-acetyltransferase [Cytophagales bacterium]HAA21965.1 GNAT family N-acetyltransferase [Cytophagales bacterium]HAP61338.1 GNAT family N-acetyltransferase [Cytophagales bacterium]